MKSRVLSIVLWSIFVFGGVCGDTPANCTYEDIRGKWTFMEGRRMSNSSVECHQGYFEAVHAVEVNLLFPNIAVDSLGHKGYWTIIYNQGFEVVINYRKYFAFSDYASSPNGTAVSFCDRIKPGRSHDVLGKNWACFKGYKFRKTPPKTSTSPELVFRSSSSSVVNSSMVEDINNVQNSWRAVLYPDLQKLSLDQLVRKAGGFKSGSFRAPPVVPAYRGLKKISLPDEFDWRNVNGVNFVSPVRNQGACGSCYAFSSLAMLESRLRVMTNNTLQVQFSPQDIVSCSTYSQGCEGGFPYAIAGKYAQDFGVVPENCYPYEGRDTGCSAARKCKRYYVADYKYVGGFYGGCNDELMMMDLVKNGPLTVAFEVYSDFMLYRSGIYHHTGLGVRFNPFKEVNHGVLVTGYGTNQATGEKFWIVKNSWGTEWGEQGYFRIRRGSNECNIESLAVSAIPIP